jgi:predicted metal-dependent RNase
MITEKDLHIDNHRPLNFGTMLDNCLVCAYEGWGERKLQDDEVLCPIAYDLRTFKCPIENKTIGNCSRKKYREYIETFIPQKIKDIIEEIFNKDYVGDIYINILKGNDIEEAIKKMFKKINKHIRYIKKNDL